MGIAAWRVWRLQSSKTLRLVYIVFGLQLCLNLVWTYLFFGLRRIDLALVEIVVLLAVIVANMMMFRNIDRLAGLLFVPYTSWVTYAAILNASLWVLNDT